MKERRGSLESPNMRSIDKEERNGRSRDSESTEDYGSLLVVYPCKAKSSERAQSSKSSELYTTPALY